MGEKRLGGPWRDKDGNYHPTTQIFHMGEHKTCNNFNNKILMTDQEIIDVVTAHKEGKSIERRTRCGNSKWEACNIGYSLAWDFNNFDYRVKEEPKYRPYKNAEEFLKASKEHGPYINTKNLHTICNYTLPYTISDKCVVWKAGYDLTSTWEELFTCNWQDGTPCGIKE